MTDMLDLQSAPRALERTTLGEVLRAARTAKGLSLRAVEAQTGISNGYLSQLETGTVKAPSPPHLFALATTYGVDYGELFRAAGYPVPGTVGYQEPSTEEALGREVIALAGGYLTPEEQHKVRQYVNDLLAARRGRV